MNFYPSILATEQARQRMVTAALEFTQPTALAATAYERWLLDQFVRGALTIDEVLAHLEDNQAKD
ncbi:hypothetical protein GO988_11955 [Hymenobacter sp. HMF4947]|uniref:Antitoxin VbhA domain-containing protein n=1 Tax=Hymenobacter ginkgonis TaxID=2682976 RepID=A0A7K1TF50_9BACT|nr:hypothetical protein [Hymenobacter ginkgonis]MVN77040.1 hypothetical protein [Hymenobacter ginkgonis]